MSISYPSQMSTKFISIQDQLINIQHITHVQIGNEFDEDDNIIDKCIRVSLTNAENILYYNGQDAQDLIDFFTTRICHKY
jgi:hypothetical protein